MKTEIARQVYIAMAELGADDELLAITDSLADGRLERSSRVNQAHLKGKSSASKGVSATLCDLAHTDK